MKHEYDAMVVGAGLAGLCCAAELVRQGARPLLICESREAGYLFRSRWIGETRAIMQFPMRQVGWAGLHPENASGWWYHLIRQLNLPTRLYPGYSGMNLTLLGADETHYIPPCASGAALTEHLVKAFPFFQDSRKEFERVLEAGAGIPYQELVRMHRVPLKQWLADLKVDETVQAMILAFATSMLEMTPSHTDMLSVFGFFILVRTMMMGEGESWAIYPDMREGLCIPRPRRSSGAAGRCGRTAFRHHLHPFADRRTDRSPPIGGGGVERFRESS